MHYYVSWKKSCLKCVLTIRCFVASVMLVLKSHCVFITLLHIALASRSYAKRKLIASFSSVLFPYANGENMEFQINDYRKRKNSNRIKFYLYVSGVGIRSDITCRGVTQRHCKHEEPHGGRCFSHGTRRMTVEIDGLTLLFIQKVLDCQLPTTIHCYAAR